MKKYILIVMLMLGFVMLTQNAMAVDLLNAENFRVEVIAEPRYVNGPSYANDGYCVDIIAVNNSNDVIDLNGLQLHKEITPLYGNEDNLATIITVVLGYQLPEEIQPHSKILLESFFARCYRHTYESPEPGVTIRTHGPVADVLITVKGLYGDVEVFYSSVHARYKKQRAIMDMNINTGIPIEQTDVEGPDAGVTSQLTSVSYTNFPKGLTSDEEDEKHGKK